MRFWMLFLWLSLLTPVRADEAACLASPDQACLLDLAAARALAQEEVRDTVGDLLAIAVIEERAGSGRADATVRRLLDLLAAREPAGGKRIELLSSGTAGVDMAGAPRLSAVLADLVSQTATDDPTDRAKLEVGLRAIAGQEDRVRQSIMDADPGVRADIALFAATGFMEADAYASAYALGDLISSDDFRALLDRTAVILLLRGDRIDAARIAAVTTADRDTRMMSLLLVARALAEQGRSAEAQALVAAVDRLSGPASSQDYLPFAKAEVLARLGQRDAALQELARSPEGLIPPRRIGEVEATAALVAGDVDEFLAVIARSERPMEGGYWVKIAVLAAMQAGQDDLEPVFGRLSADHLPFALNAFGLQQSRAGDMQTAQATLSRLRSLGAAGRVHGDFRAALARLMVRTGDMAEGVALAAEGGDPRLIAELATLLPE